MKQAKKRIALAVLIFAVMGIAQLSTSLGKGDGGNKAGLPKGDWTLTAIPYLEANYRANPVVVKSVTTEADKGLTVTKVGILSRSKTVSAVRLRWYLTTESNPEVILRQGETPDIQVAGGVAAGQAREMEYAVVSFSKLYPASEVLKGNFVINIAVSAVKYDDGTSWIGQAQERLDYMPVQSEGAQVLERAHTSGAAPALQQNCFTTCRWDINHYACGFFSGTTACTIVNGACQVTYCGS
jgi:hypothetical protein